MPHEADVAIAGNGPAGLALGAACGERGLRVVVVALDHERRWPNTYGVWSDQLDDAGLAQTWAASWPETVVRTPSRTLRLARRYCLLDNARLQDELRGRLSASGGVEHRGRAAGARPGELALADGSVCPARLVVDATGHVPALLRTAGPAPAFQSAFGVVATCSSPPGEAGAMTLMDVRQKPIGAPADPTFLYAMDLGADRWFVQETSLARRRPLAFADLESRLRRRLAAMGVTLSDEGAVERCVFPMGTPAPRPQPVLGYGAAAAMVHPATGYQVGEALARAPALAGELQRAVASPSPEGRARAGWDALWSRDRRLQRALHERGLACLLRFDGSDLERFFETFFALPEALWRAYLGDARSVADTARTMAAVFARVGPLRPTLAAAALHPALRTPLA